MIELPDGRIVMRVPTAIAKAARKMLEANAQWIEGDLRQRAVELVRISSERHNREASLSLAQDEALWEREYLLWNETGLRNIKPSSLRFGEYPEGWNVPQELGRFITPFITKRILELGCGYGRLCSGFATERYIGVDINVQAIARARELFPTHHFESCAYVDDYPKADVVLAYTVFGHLSDDSLHKVIAKLDGVQHVFIAEVMNVRDLDKNTSSNYDVPARFHSVFFRSVEDYEKILGRFKFRFVQSLRKPYHCYPTAKMDILHFEYCPPPKVLTFPQDLANPNIDFDGIYDDGWVADRFSVRLSPSSSQLTLAGMNPGLHAPLEVRVEGKMQIANAGDFQLVFEVDRTADHAGWIRVETNSLARLPNNDGRHVGFLLRQIGFET